MQMNFPSQSFQFPQCQSNAQVHFADPEGVSGTAKQHNYSAIRLEGKGETTQRLGRPGVDDDDLFRLEADRSVLMLCTPTVFS